MQCLKPSSVQIYNKNLVHFPTLQSLQVQNSQKYAKVITELRDDLDHRFTDFKKSAMHFNLFSCPFSVKIEEVPENLQMECIDLQCSSDLREKFKDFPLLEFSKNMSLKKTIRGFTDWQFSWPHYSAALTCASKFFRGWTISNTL